MGVKARIRLWAPDDRTAGAAFGRAFDRLDQVEQALSDYRPSSELSAVNRAAGSEAVRIGPDLLAVLERAVDLGVASDGAFDVTAGPLIDLWRESRRTGLAAEPSRLALARAATGLGGLRLDADASSAQLTRPGMRLDLGGIGKGWAAREAVTTLTEAGTPRCLVSIGGDIAAGDPPPGRAGWRVEAGRDGEASPARLLIARQAVSTSGDSAQRITIDGVTRSHIVDPRTGLGSTTVAGVTVLADHGGDADALASAIYLAGEDAAIVSRLLERAPGAAVRIHRPDDRDPSAQTEVHDPNGTWSIATRAATQDGGDARAGAPVSVDPILGVPIVDLDRPEHAHRFAVVDREPGQYLGHPTTALLEDGRTIICVYPKGHGRGAIVMKRSRDGGRSWSERLPTPENWATSQETPTIHRIQDSGDARRLILFSGLHPIRIASSDDDGETWTSLAPVGDWGGIVAMSTVEPVGPRNGDAPPRLMALFHDDGRFFAPGGGRAGGTFTLYRTWSDDAGRTWSDPDAIWSGSSLHLCEPGVVRSPDGGTIAILLRENRRRSTSHVMFSRDEGRTWSEPRRLSLALTGDRHTARYGPGGRLFVSFRDMAMGSPTHGDWVAWVGTFEEMLSPEPAGYRVRIQDNFRGTDCGYPGVEILPDGTIVTTTYGGWVEGEEPFILTCRVRLEELDSALAAGHAVEGPAPGIPTAP